MLAGAELVVDIGCADRWVEARVPDRCTYIGVDYPGTARTLYRTTPDVFADASALPLRDGSASVVLMLEVLEHLRHPAEALAEAHRVLRPAGQLLLTMPFLYPVHDAPFDFQRFTRHGLERDLLRAGFELRRLEPTLGSMESACLLCSLALAGSALQALRSRSPMLPLAFLLLLLVPAVNLAGWLLGRLLPPWSAISAGYSVIAAKHALGAGQVRSAHPCNEEEHGSA